MLRISRLAPLLAVLALTACGGHTSSHHVTPTPAACAHGYATPYGCQAHSSTFGLPPKNAPKPKLTLTRTLEQFDSVNLSQIPSSAAAVAGYTSGLFPTFSRLVGLFPHAHLISVAVNAGHIARCLDIEPGDAVPSQAASWVTTAIHFGVYHPCLWENASELPAVLANLNAAHIARSSYLIWLADWTFHPGLVSGSDCTQWTDHAFSRNLDESTCAVGFYAGKPKPRPKPKPKPARVICFGAHSTPNSKACKPIVSLYQKRSRAAISTIYALNRVGSDLKANHCVKPYRRGVCVKDGRSVRVLTLRKAWFESHALSLHKQYS
jgi:hypothetical protein